MESERRFISVQQLDGSEPVSFFCAELLGHSPDRGEPTAECSIDDDSGIGGYVAAGTAAVAATAYAIYQLKKGKNPFRSKPGAQNGSLGDLTKAEVNQIQGVVDRAGRPLEVVGSAATGTRRGVGTNLPVGKGPGTRSDIDVLVPPSSRGHFEGLENGLPSLDPKSGIIPGTHNPHIGPAIRFEPGAAPRYVPGAGGG